MPVVKGIKIRRLSNEAPARKWTLDELKPYVSRRVLRIPGAFDGAVLFNLSGDRMRLRCVLAQSVATFGVDPGVGRGSRSIYYQPRGGECWRDAATVVVRRRKYKARRKTKASRKKKRSRRTPTEDLSYLDQFSPLGPPM